MMAAVAYSTRARLLPPDPLPALDGYGGIVPDGPRPPIAAPHSRPALLAAARHRRGAIDDARRRPAPVGAVRRVGAGSRAGRVPGTLGGGGALGGAACRALRGPSGACALQGGVGRGRSARGRAGGGGGGRGRAR